MNESAFATLDGGIRDLGRFLSFASSPPTGTRDSKLTPRYLDQIVGPLVISGALFLAVLTNFIVRRT